MTSTPPGRMLPRSLQSPREEDKVSYMTLADETMRLDLSLRGLAAEAAEGPVAVTLLHWN